MPGNIIVALIHPNLLKKMLLYVDLCDPLEAESDYLLLFTLKCVLITHQELLQHIGPYHQDNAKTTEPVISVFIFSSSHESFM